MMNKYEVKTVDGVDNFIVGDNLEINDNVLYIYAGYEEIVFLTPMSNVFWVKTKGVE